MTKLKQQAGDRGRSLQTLLGILTLNTTYPGFCAIIAAANLNNVDPFLLRPADSSSVVGQRRPIPLVKRRYRKLTPTDRSWMTRYSEVEPAQPR